MKRVEAQRMKTQTPTNYHYLFELTLLKITGKASKDKNKTKLEERKN